MRSFQVSIAPTIGRKTTDFLVFLLHFRELSLHYPVVSLLEVQNLTTRFHTRNGVVHAVEDVSFSVDKGRTLGIVGESGSGKSVTCYSLLGLIPWPPGRIHSGSALFAGPICYRVQKKSSERFGANESQ